MTAPGLPARQLAVLRYLDAKGPSRVRDITAALGQPRSDVQNTLRLLADKGLAFARLTFPATWVITPDGRLALAFPAEGGEQ